mmetsp:Transcript_49172/g.56702  ORF Transcript_49172/g.56702 Transcript_49172/m.56702 type:complete len:81 (+) Transcript_49172:2-244(+)
MIPFLFKGHVYILLYSFLVLSLFISNFSKRREFETQAFQWDDEMHQVGECHSNMEHLEKNYKHYVVHRPRQQIGRLHRQD